MIKILLGFINKCIYHIEFNIDESVATFVFPDAHNILFGNHLFIEIKRKS